MPWRAGWTRSVSNIGDLHDQAATAAEQKIFRRAPFGAMASRFHGAEGAFAYLSFHSAVVCRAPPPWPRFYQEAGSRWALFVGV